MVALTLSASATNSCEMLVRRAGCSDPWVRKNCVEECSFGSMASPDDLFGLLGAGADVSPVNAAAPVATPGATPGAPEPEDDWSQIVSDAAAAGPAPPSVASDAVAPSLAVDPQPAADHHEQCGVLAARGGCTASPDWMLVHCATSCASGAVPASSAALPAQPAPDVVGATTLSVAEAAPPAALGGEAAAAAETEVVSASEASAPPQETSEMSSADAPPPTDWHEQCAMLASRGGCDASPEWMLVHCAASCASRANDAAAVPESASSPATAVAASAPELAAPPAAAIEDVAPLESIAVAAPPASLSGEEEVGEESASAPAPPPPAADHHEQCGMLAARGGCSASPEWMLVHCATSCASSSGTASSPLATAAPPTQAAEEAIGERAATLSGDASRRDGHDMAASGSTVAAMPPPSPATDSSRASAPGVEDVSRLQALVPPTTDGSYTAAMSIAARAAAQLSAAAAARSAEASRGALELAHAAIMHAAAQRPSDVALAAEGALLAAAAGDADARLAIEAAVTAVNVASNAVAPHAPERRRSRLRHRRAR